MLCSNAGPHIRSDATDSDRWSGAPENPARGESMSLHGTVNTRMRRARRIRVMVGLGLIAVIATLVFVQVATGWHLRQLRVLAFAGIVVVFLLAAFVAVTFANGRRMSARADDADGMPHPRLDV